MSQMRNQTRIKPEFIDIKETLKKQIGAFSDDNYIDTQAGTSTTIVAKTDFKVSFDNYYITLDTRACSNYNNTYGQFGFDLGIYLQQTNTVEYTLENVVEITIDEPFYIPKLATNESFIFERVLITIQELSSSKGTSANAAPPFHFSLTVTDAGLGRFLLTPIRSSYLIKKPVRLSSVTLQFSTPVSYNNYIPFPPNNVSVTYAATGAFTTTFNNAVGSGFVVGDVLYFSSSDPGIQNNPANAAFFNTNGHTITAVVPLQVTISGAFTILDGANNPIPVGTVFTVLLASRIIRVPLNFKTVRTGDGNYITAISN